MEKVLENEVLMLFELLDFSPILMLERPQTLNREGLYPIAWGFLRLSGLAQYHTEDSKVQLYEHLFDGKKFETTQRFKFNDNKVPDVYYDFIWPDKVKYPGFISLRIDCKRIPMITRVMKDPYHIYEEEINEDYIAGNRSKSINIRNEQE